MVTKQHGESPNGAVWSDDLDSHHSLIPLLLSSARAVLLPPMASWPSAEADVLSRLLQLLHKGLLDSCS